MKLGMTGNRYGLTDDAKQTLSAFLDSNKISESHHGDCIGADADFHKACSLLKIKTIIHPPDNNKNRAFCQGDIILPTKKYIERDHDIVNETDMMVAFPPTNNEILRSGTWTTIRYAIKKNKKMLIVFPDGTTKKYHY
jgi:hypothetical protein